MIQINFAKDLRILGVDDGPFVRGVDKVCPIVGVLMRLDGKIENIAADSLSVDGGDVTGKFQVLWIC